MRAMVVAASLLSLAAPATAQEELDYLISGATIVDGTGAPGYRADLGIAAGRIAKIGKLDGAPAKRRIDATGKIVIPGFIDLHGHADDQQGHWRGMRADDPKRRGATAHVSQGITTSVANSDGLAPFMPLAEQMAITSRHDIGLNLAYMVSHNRVRYAVMRDETPRPAKPDEIEKMKALVREDMEAGAWGMAAVLEMRDGSWTTTEELIGVTQALQPYDGVFIAHPRSQSEKPSWWVPSLDKGPGSYPWAPSMFEASKELIDVAEASRIRVSISHLSMRGPDPNKDAFRTADAVEAARRRGVKIYGDMNVWRGNPIGIFSPMIPSWATATKPPSPTFFVNESNPQGKVNYGEQMRVTLADSELRRKLETDVAYMIEFWGGAKEIYITTFPDKSYIGKTLAQLAAQRRISPVEMVIALALEGDPYYPGGAVAYGNLRSESNIERFVKSDWVSGDTDGYLTLPGDPGYLHPRTYGSYPAWIRTYVLERKAVSLEFAVRSLTGLAAEIVGLQDRGTLREGLAADLSVIDLAAIAPQATFYDVHRYSTGFDYVFVNGTPVVAESKVTWALPGKVLRRAAR
jgi:N-acyl-D-amino-acid deacylase